jgi:hypothetical protein
MKQIKVFCATILFNGFFAIGLAFADSAELTTQDKNQYHLFNPTPNELIREMSTDRPDKTESAYTVDAGHYQIEMSILDYTYDRHNQEGTQTDADTLSIAPTNLKVGLSNNVDLQVVINPYIRERAKEDSEVERKSGFGDVQTRVKINLWGNDGGKTAFAMMPFVKFPTNTDNLGNNATEGGIILPLAVELPGEWSMGLMTEFDFNEDLEDDDHYATDFINSITFGHQIFGDLNGYIEFFSSVTDGNRSGWIGTVDTGLTYGLTKDIQLDAGVNIGVTRSADDFNPFLGLSMRY